MNLGKAGMDSTQIYPSQFSDRHNYSGSEMWVNEIHLVLKFDGKLDQPRLRKALRLLIDAEPLLGARFVKHWLKPYWQRLSVHELDSAALLDVVDETGGSTLEELSDSFFRDYIDLMKGPQIRALLVAGNETDRMILKIQHLMCDAGGFKELLNLLSDIYTKLGDQPDYKPSVDNGSRSLHQIYSRFSFYDLMRIFYHGCVQFQAMSFPPKVKKYSSNWIRTGKLGYVFKRFPKERFLQIKQYAQEKGVTINDLFVSALLRAMVKQSNLNHRGWLRLAGTVDLRRFIPGRKAEGLCQMSSLYTIKIKSNKCANHDETLAIVKKQMDLYKRNFIGLGVFLVYWFTTKPLPYSIFNRMMRLGTKIGKWIGNTTLGFTNLGLIDNKGNNFGPHILLSAEMTCPGSIPPAFLCALSGYGETLTLNAGTYDSSIQKKSIKELFDIVDQELTP